jgi:hypothetical protein
MSIIGPDPDLGAGSGHLGVSMSMYTQLLQAAIGEHPAGPPEATTTHAVAEVRRCRVEVGRSVSAGIDPDAVPVELAQQIGYDVALLRLAAMLGVESDPSRFEQPQLERARLEAMFNELGVNLEPATEAANGTA